ncbi:MAG: helix-turn-helix transcriptional regulator [Methylococcales bacterium]|nr:helix-turn-helix transcriptional regulator [Methylococcales bacterium]
MTAGSRIRELRKNKNNLSQAKLAAIMELTSASMSSIELGKSNPTSDLIIKLSQFFDVSTDYLLTGKKETQEISEQEREILNVLREDQAMTNAMIEVANVKKKAINYLGSYVAMNAQSLKSPLK